MITCFWLVLLYQKQSKQEYLDLRRHKHLSPLLVEWMLSLDHCTYSGFHDAENSSIQICATNNRCNFLYCYWRVVPYILTVLTQLSVLWETAHQRCNRSVQQQSNRWQHDGLLYPLDSIVMLTNRADTLLLISWVWRPAANQTGPNNVTYSHSVCEIWTWHSMFWTHE